MPSLSHDGLVALLREQPAVVLALLRRMGVRLPRSARLEVTDSAVAPFVPAGYKADLAVELRGAKGPVLAVIVEPQLHRDPDKRFAWPLYSAATHARLRCTTVLLVIALRPSIARWASRPIETLQPGSPFSPIVVGPAAIPRITDPREARRAPELAVLSAIAHGNEPEGAAVVIAALDAAARLDDARGALYHDLVYAALRDAARRAVEALMDLKKYEFQTEFARKHQAEGRAEGKAEGKAEALLTVLGARRLEPSPAERAQIEACTEHATLDRWLARAATASSVAEVIRQ